MKWIIFNLYSRSDAIQQRSKANNVEGGAQIENQYDDDVVSCYTVYI